ncbi:serine threonine protein kinase [Moniliophthora roreri]|nr:serine threonine protein kinase [Moniliophthora roreri]
MFLSGRHIIRIAEDPSSFRIQGAIGRPLIDALSYLSREGCCETDEWFFQDPQFVAPCVGGLPKSSELSLTILLPERYYFENQTTTSGLWVSLFSCAYATESCHFGRQLLVTYYPPSSGPGILSQQAFQTQQVISSATSSTLTLYIALILNHSRNTSFAKAQVYLVKMKLYQCRNESFNPSPFEYPPSYLRVTIVGNTSSTVSFFERSKTQIFDEYSAMKSLFVVQP